MHDIYMQQEKKKAEKIAGRATVDLVDDDPRIKVVLIMGAVNDNQLTIDQFRGRGWKLTGLQESSAWNFCCRIEKKQFHLSSALLLPGIIDDLHATF